MNTMMQAFAKTRLSMAVLFSVMLLAAAAVPASGEVKIQKVTSDSGVTAWLVENYSVPIIAINFAFEGGSAQDPAGKEGLAELMTGLFDEGAGDLDSEAFQVRLDDAGAEMRFNAGRDAVSGSMRMLAENKEEAFDLLRLAVEQPRFDAAPIARIRAQMISGIVAGQRDPETAARTKWSEALYGDHPYARPDEGTEKSLSAISADDLHAYHKAVFAREKLHVAIVGAIDAATVKLQLDKVFGNLPEKPSLKPVADVDWKLGQDVSVDYDLPQTSLQLAFPGVARDAPDFFAAYLMNHILGGGTFSSRLFEEVREKRGLAYGATSSLVTHDHASGLVIQTATRSDRAAETLEVMRDVIQRMAQEGPTAEELAAAKKFIIGSYALNALNSSGAIASTLLALQMDGLGIDYIQERVALINDVTLDEVKAAARKLLTAQPSVLVVGPPLADGSKG